MTVSVGQTSQLLLCACLAAPTGDQTEHCPQGSPGEEGPGEEEMFAGKPGEGDQRQVEQRQRNGNSNGEQKHTNVHIHCSEGPEYITVLVQLLSGTL